MTFALTPTQLLAGLGVLFVVVMIWRGSVRRARATADAARAGARLLSLTGRVLFLAGLIVGVQWLVLTRPGASPWLVLAVLGLPALFSAYTLTRALIVTSVDSPRRGGRR